LQQQTVGGEKKLGYSIAKALVRTGKAKTKTQKQRRAAAKQSKRRKKAAAAVAAAAHKAAKVAKKQQRRVGRATKAM
jgi:hypothetical protein